MNAMADISNETSRNAQMSSAELEVIRNRLIHLLNRARRIRTRTRIQESEETQLMTAIKRAMLRWGPRETRVPVVDRTTVSGVEEIVENPGPLIHPMIDSSGLARRATPENRPMVQKADTRAEYERHQIPTSSARRLFATRMTDNSTPTQQWQSWENRAVDSPPPTSVRELIAEPTNHAAVNTVPLAQQLSFDGFPESRQAQEMGYTGRVPQYLNQMSQAYAYAAETYDNDNSRVEHQKLLNRMQSLMSEVRQVQ